MNKLFLCVTIDFPFKKACLSEPDAFLSSNRSSQTVLQTVHGWEWKWERMETVVLQRVLTDFCPYKVSKDHNLRWINIRIVFSEFKSVGLGGCIKNRHKCCFPSIIPLQNAYCNKTHTCYWPCCRILICFYSDWAWFYEELSHHQTPFKFSGNWGPEITSNIVLYCNFFFSLSFPSHLWSFGTAMAIRNGLLHFNLSLFINKIKTRKIRYLLILIYFNIKGMFEMTQVLGKVLQAVAAAALGFWSQTSKITWKEVKHLKPIILYIWGYI